MNDTTFAPRDFELAMRETHEQGRAQHLAILDRLRDLQIGLQGRLQHEASRIAAQLGDDHPRGRRLTAARRSNAAAIAAVEVEREIARVAVPHLGDQAALVHGRLTDNRRRGIAGLTVHLAVRDGSPRGEAPAALSDRSGYFALELDAAALEAGSGLFLSVFDARGELLHRQTEPVDVTPGSGALMTVRLKRPAPDNLVPGNLTPVPVLTPRPPAVAAPAAAPEPPNIEPAPEPEEAATPAELPQDTEDAGGYGSTAEPPSRDQILNSLAGDERFAEIGASVPKLKRQLGDLGVETTTELHEWLESPDAEIRDRLRLRNLKSSAIFRILVRRSLEDKN